MNVPRALITTRGQELTFFRELPPTSSGATGIWLTTGADGTGKRSLMSDSREIGVDADLRPTASTWTAPPDPASAGSVLVMGRRLTPATYSNTEYGTFMKMTLVNTNGAGTTEGTIGPWSAPGEATPVGGTKSFMVHKNFVYCYHKTGPTAYTYSFELASDI